MSEADSREALITTMLNYIADTDPDGDITEMLVSGFFVGEVMWKGHPDPILVIRRLIDSTPPWQEAGLLEAAKMSNSLRLNALYD